MKKIIFLFFVYLFYFSNLNANEGVFFLDVDYVLKNSNSGKIVVNKLQELNSQNNIKFKNSEDEIKSLEKEITKVKNIISKDELNKKINYFKKISPVVQEFMKVKSIKIIIDRKNIFIADSNYDITEDLIKFLNEKIN